MSAIAYTVKATFPDETLRGEYIAWLENGHVEAVIRGGAHSAMILKFETGAGGKPAVETRYIFPTREVYERYVREVAPALRADGLSRFGPERGVTMERTVAEVV